MSQLSAAFFEPLPLARRASPDAVDATPAEFAGVFRACREG